jgi:hypothetical protein
MATDTRTVFAAVAIGLCSVGSSLAGAETVVEKGQVDVQGDVYQVLDKDMTKVTFSSGSSTLPGAELATLSAFVQATKGEAKLDRFLVAAWGDKPYPEKGELSSGQRKLAEARATHIMKALQASGATTVDTFEMTKHPNWLQRVFSTETAEVKGKGMSTTHNERLLKELGERIRTKGGPGTAVIIAKFKNEAVAH